MTFALRTIPRFFFLAACFTAAAATCALSPPAWAQSDETASGLVVEEIVVTARKREESAQDVPVAITALSAELENPTIRNIADLNGFAPNVNIGVDRSRGPGAAAISIRGVSPPRTDDNSFDAPVGVMVDGIYLGSLAGQVIENFDLERIEILRGPQGTLFGKNTVGGVLNVVRSRPTGELGAKLKFTAGKWGQQELRAIVNAPIIEDTLSAKVFFTSIQSDGFIRNTHLGRDGPKKDYSNYGATFLFTPNSAFEALFTIEKFDDSSELGASIVNWNLAPGVAPPPPPGSREPDYSGGFVGCLVGFTSCRTSLDTPNTIATDFPNPATFEVDALTLRASYDLSDEMRLVSVTGYREMIEDRISDFDGAVGNFITIERLNDYQQFSEELRLEWNRDKLSFVGGLYYWKSEFEQDWVTGGTFWFFLQNVLGIFVQTPAGLEACWAGAFAPNHCDTGAPADHPGWQGPELAQLLYEDQTTTSIALFAQADYEIAPNWTFTLGLRWTEEEKDFLGAQAYIAPVQRQYVNNHPSFADLSRTWREYSPKIGISHQFSEDVLLYASYAEGFHSGGFFGVNQNTRDFVRDQYDPEFAHSFELGMKGQFLNNRLQINAAYFYNQFDDKQEASIQLDADTATVATVFDNVASAIYWGLEGELKFVLNEYTNIFASIGYLDASYDEFETDLNPNDDDSPENRGIEDASHLTPRNAPETTWAVGGTVNIPLGPGEMSFYAKYSEISEIETNLVNISLFRLDAREYVDASVSYSWNNVRATLFGRNLTDDVYELAFPIATLFATGSIIPGRSWGLELEVEL